MVSLESVDLDAYFARIGYGGCTVATLATLDALVLAHVTTVPFNNLAILLGEPIPLALSAVERKIVTEGRGGYCFEQNGFFMSVLRQLGFDVIALGARARINVPRGEVPPRTHMFLRVEFPDGPRLVDVGFGGLSPTSSLRLETDIEQATPHETRRIVSEDGRYFHQALLNSGWSDAYEFTLEEFHPIDQLIANWWTSTHPTSRFRNRLIAARAGPDGTRFTIDNQKFSQRRADGFAETRDIVSSVELLAVLGEQFDLHFRPGTVFAVPGLAWPDETTGG